jgi:hypothetical protein
MKEVFSFPAQLLQSLKASEVIEKIQKVPQRKFFTEITINVPVVYMGRYKVVLRGDYP